ncbi:MAG: hypothetical protein JAY74_13475 [Candidatus Thiodiazotropha taylori]|nr:hypothetical protein [Candidatus Thiodiazotropha taylori]
MAQYDFTRTLAADQEIILDCAESNRFQILAGSAEFWVKPDGRGRIKTELGLGQKIKRGFDKLWLQNGSTAQTITIKIGDDEIIDNRMVGTVDISGGIKFASNPTVSHGAVSVTTTATLIQAKNLSRATCLIQNLGTGAIYIGNSNAVTSANGIYVAPGGSTNITFTDPIYAIAATGLHDVRYLEESVS